LALTDTDSFDPSIQLRANKLTSTGSVQAGQAQKIRVKGHRGIMGAGRRISGKQEIRRLVDWLIGEWIPPTADKPAIRSVG